MEVINSITKSFKNIDNIDLQLSKRYGQKIEDVQEWLSLTEWTSRQLKKDELEKIQNQLLELQLIESKLPSETILHSF